MKNNPVDGDVQALIAFLKEKLASLKLAVKQRAFENVRDELVMDLKSAEISLAALTAEPVYQFIVNNPDKDGYIEWADCNPDYFSNEPSDSRRILYTTPPAQLFRPLDLPDDAPNALVALCQQMYDHKFTGQTVAHDVWQDCLDEMRLNATAQPVSEQHGKIADALESLIWPNMASGNKEIINAAIQALRATSEQPVSDGWLKCSERAPAAGETVLVYMKEPIHSATDYAIATYDKYGFSRSRVTHWMPLSAAPEVNP